MGSVNCKLVPPSFLPSRPQVHCRGLFPETIALERHKLNEVELSQAGGAALCTLDLGVGQVAVVTTLEAAK